MVGANSYTEENPFTLTATRDDHFEQIGEVLKLEVGKTYTYSFQTDGEYGESQAEQTGDTIEAFVLAVSPYGKILGHGPSGTAFVATQSDCFFRVDVNKNGATHKFWNFKIEAGKYPTRYVKNIDELDNKIRNIKVGTRNLLLQTNQGTTGWAWNSQDGSGTVENQNVLGVDAAKIRVERAATGWVYAAYSGINYNAIIPTKTYTIEFDVLSNVDSYIYVRLVDANGANFSANFGEKFDMKAGEWQHFSATATLNNVAIKQQKIYFAGVNTTGQELTIANLIMVEGTMCGSWLPAPEDLMFKS